jgi:zinc/manganese transport system substrate-binding protein
MFVACSSKANPSATSSPTSGGSKKVLQVVAGENFWGSIATQLGGTHVNVQSVVSDPNADPHEYESSSDDARAFADADYVILNGAGYDSWGDKLLSASPKSSRKTFVVADLLGKKEGDNPHFWYSADYVEQVIQQISSDYKALDPADAAYFETQKALYETALAPYHARIAAIKQQFAGKPVASTESIFVYLADALGVSLISPPDFMQAVAEGNDPPAASVATFQDQIQGKQVVLLVYNLQTATAVTTNIRHIAAAQDIPVVGVTETVQPPDATFQDWMSAQLIAIQNGLNANALTH